GVDFDAAGPGTCLIWHLRFEEGLTGAEIGANAADLQGCFDLSDPVTVVRLEAPTNTDNAVSLYPLPATDVLNVNAGFLDTQSVKARIFDLGGNDVSGRVQQIETDNLSFDVQSLPTGIYLLHLKDDQGRSVMKKIAIK
ncbi:MAG: T9SS type A sorting domain-containing protein, partial [Bacteroidota bacterium]